MTALSAGLGSACHGFQTRGLRLMSQISKRGAAGTNLSWEKRGPVRASASTGFIRHPPQDYTSKIVTTLACATILPAPKREGLVPRLIPLGVFVLAV